MISRRSVLPLVLVTAGALVVTGPAPTLAQPVGRAAVDGAVGIGDSYFPRDGNGGYDVSRYRVRLRDGTNALRIGLVTLRSRRASDR